MGPCPDWCPYKEIRTQTYPGDHARIRRRRYVQAKERILSLTDTLTRDFQPPEDRGNKYTLFKQTLMHMLSDLFKF